MGDSSKMPDKINKIVLIDTYLYKPGLIAILFLMAILFFSSGAFGQSPYTSVASGNWGADATWSGVGVPVAGDVVTIANGHSITFLANAACASLTFAGATANSTVTLSAGITLAVSGAITIPQANAGFSNTLAVGAGTLNAGSVAFTSGGTASTRHRITISTGTVNVSGNVTQVGSLGSASIVFSSTGLLQLGGTFFTPLTGTLTTVAGSTVEYDGVAQTAQPFTYLGNLTLSGSGAKTFATTPTVNGVLSLEGTASVAVTLGVVTYGASATLQYNKPAAYTTTDEEWITPFAGTGGVIIKNTGTITLNALKQLGTNSNVPLNINTGATLSTNNFGLTFHGDFINDGTLTAGSSPMIITGTFTPQSIDGFTTTGAVSMTKTAGTATFAGTVNGGALTINGLGGTLNLGAGLTHTFTGAWNRNNGTLDGGSSTLRIGGSVAGVTGTFTAGTGTVDWNAAGVQTLAAVTYNNLTLSGSGVKTSTGVTVNGILSMEGTATASAAITYGGAATLQYNTATGRTVSVNEWPSPFAGTGGVIIKNTGTITLNALKQLGTNTNVPLNVNTGATLSTNNFGLTFHGDFINDGTLTAGSSPMIITGTFTPQSIDGFTTTGAVSMTKTAGTATFTGAVNGGALTINGLGGTLNLGAGLTHTFTGAWNRNNGTLNGGSSTLRIGGSVAGVTGTFTAGTGTVEWNAAGIQTLAAVTYNNLILSGSGNKTFSGVTTISGNLSVSGTAVANLGAGLTHTASTLTLGAAGQVSGSHGSTGSLATNKNDTYFLNTSNGIVNVSVCSGTSSGTGITYYSRNATLGGNWNDANSWTTVADGSGGPLAVGQWPRRFDNVVIRAGHTVTVDATDDNKSCGISPDGLLRTNVGPFTSSGTAMFYQTGDLLIDGTLSVTTGVNLMLENYSHITSTGNLTVPNLVNLGYLEADASSTLSSANDIVLAGFSTTIINTVATVADELIISFLDAVLCGTGSITLTGGSGSALVYANPATAATHVNQICTTFAVNCSGVGCTGFPVPGAGALLLGNTGPGGVGNSTNNKLWLRANDLSLANGAAVASWNDVSGNALTASNATAGERPTFATNSANGFPSLTFDGTSDNLSLGAPAALNFVPQTDSWSFLIAYRAPANGISTTPNQGTLFSKAWNTNRNYQYQIDDISGANSAFASYIGNGLDAGTVAINTNAWIVGSHTNTTATKNSFSNEAANFSGVAIVAGADASTEVLVGARRDTGPANGSEGFLFTGNIAEIMMYNRVVNAAQRIIISDYLAAKYAVTLSANDFYTMDNAGNGNFDYEVAGIGQAADGSNHRDARGTGIVRMWNPSNLGNGEFLIWGHDNTTFYSSTVTGVGAPIQERLSRTWRLSELGGDVGTVSVSFDISLLATPLGSNLRLLIDRDNDGFGDNDVTPIAGTFVDNTIVFSGVNFQDDDKFTLGNTDVTKPLPIELISFSANLNNDIVELKWSTASEVNNNFFTIERASNIEEFEGIGNPIYGKGTTAEKNSYSATDENPLYGRSYYRLKQTDFDGRFTYSDLQVIDYEGPRFSTLKVYPNPSQGHKLTIEVNGLKDQSTVPVQIYNVQGQKVYDHIFEVSAPGLLKHDFEVGSLLKNGLYIIKAGQTLQLTQKIIID